MAAITRWVLAHRRLVAAFWLIVAMTGLASVGPATAALSQQFTAPPGYEGYATNDSIARAYGTGGAGHPLVLVAVLPHGATAATRGVRDQLTAALAAVAAALPRARVASYASTGNRAFVSADGRITFAMVYPFGARSGPGAVSVAPAITRALAGHTVDGVPLRVTGLDELATSGGGGGGPGVLAETLIGALGALIVLVVVFGSFLALVPLLIALVAVPTTFLLVWGVTAVTDVSFIVEFLTALIGLGIAIDYSLLIIMRWREERAQGHANALAVERAMATAGSAVIFSGATVAISLLTLVVLPVPFLRSVGYGGLLIPLVTVAVAMTLLPVLLATVGPRLEWPRRVPTARGPAPSGQPGRAMWCADAG